MKEDVKNVSESTETEGTEEVVQESEETEEQSEETKETTPKAGDKTEANLLLESLRTERELRRQLKADKEELEKKLLELQNTDGTYSDEGLRLKGEIDKLREELSQERELKTLESIQVQFPAIKDKADEFAEFRKDYPGISLDKVAKLFIVENDLAPMKERKGLERGNTGTKSAPSGKISPEEVKNLRENNWRKYQKLLREGKI